ncbi:MAG: RluA family pseudouridine synthase [Myxococcales bacterium]|nr:RluA family pseudouridine synthase [Myxococcales bacterium]MCB9707461.1 RluA family pseudouridine synthase [Myxococcales bacterium]
MREEHVDIEFENVRLDRWLVQSGIVTSRRSAQHLIRDGQVRVNDRMLNKATLLKAGDRVSIEGDIPSRDFVPVSNAELALHVVYEDEWLVVIDKPADMPCHPLKPTDAHTLVNALVARYPQMLGVGYSPRESGLVHRLDNDTSGLLLAAKDARTFGLLSELLLGGEVTKHYLALCEGHVEAPLDLALPLRPDPKNKRRMCVDAHAYDLSTLRHGRILDSKRYGDYSLLKMSVGRAMRHQIRCHLAAIKHPIVGDTLYGGLSTPGFDRHFLHAHHMCFVHPHTRETMSIQSPLPVECAKLLKLLEA